MRALRRLMTLGFLLAALCLAFALSGCERAEEILFAPTPSAEPVATEMPVTPTEPPAPTPDDGDAASPPSGEFPLVGPTPLPLDTHLEPLAEAGEQAIYQGDYARAIGYLEQVVDQVVPQDKPYWALRLARAYMLNGQHDLATAQVSWIVANSPDASLRAESLGLMGSAKEAAGDLEGAIQAYEAYLIEVDDAAPFVLWRVARAYKALDDVGQQIRALERIDTARLEPSFRAEVLAELAAAYRRNKDPDTAITAYEQILEFAEIPEYRALISHYKGETLREAGHEAEAFAAFYDIVTKESTSFAAYLSLLELAGLPDPPPTPVVASAEGITNPIGVREPMSDLVRGMIHYHAQQYSKALEYLYYYLQDEPPLGMADARYYLGLTLTKQGQYAEAVKHFDRAIELAGDQELLANAWMDKAWAVGASGSDPSGIYYEFYVNHPAHERAPEALWNAAQASERRNDWAQAAMYYGTLVDRFGADKRATDAAFRQGLAAYAQGDPYSASVTWRAALEHTEDAALRARLITWMGLAAQKAGQMEQADIHWKEAARIAPESYYGLRARDLLSHARPRLGSGFDPEVVPALPTEAEWAEIMDWVRTTFPEAEGVDLNGHVLFREALALHRLGWHEEMARSMRRLQHDLRDDPIALLTLAHQATMLRAYPTAIWCGQRLERLAREAGVTEPPELLTRLAYPNVYSDLIAENAIHYDLDPLLYLALVRQESLFNPWAKSYAGALGLAQVMPATGEWIASSIGLDGHNHDLLLRPHISLRFGAWFLDLLLGLYDRDWIAALVAYNAGPGNLRNWTGGQPIEDHDLFYETIPVKQAQDYVTYIYEHYHRYERLYRQNR